MSDGIEYGNLMHEAMRGLIRNVLIQVSKEGLPGQHHFFITFDTSHPDAELADWLSDRYPTEMTVDTDGANTSGSAAGIAKIDPAPEQSHPKPKGKVADGKKPKDADVVSLDSFRKP